MNAGNPTQSKAILAEELLTAGGRSSGAADVRAQAEVRRAMEVAYRQALLAGKQPAALALEVFDLPYLLEQTPEIDAQDLREALLGALLSVGHEGQLIGLARGEAIVLLLPQASLEEAAAFGKRLITSTRKLEFDGREAPLRVSVSIGLAAVQPGHELLCETLLRVAEAGVAVAHNRCGECCVHTMLYSLMQTRAEKQLAEDPELKALVQAARAEAGTRDERDVLQPQPAPKRPRKRKRRRHDPDEPEELTKLREEIYAKLRAGVDPDSADATRLYELAGELAKQAILDLKEKLTEEERKKSDEQIELLTRRLAKLAATLEETEHRLEEAYLTVPDDDGVASRFRSVQGLSGVERNYEQKLHLLQDLLEANLELQKATSA